jgi:hypothetical protein
VLRKNILLVRPRRSSARRISGAKITGIAISRAGNEASNSQVNAGRFSKLVSTAKENGHGHEKNVY